MGKSKYKTKSLVLIASMLLGATQAFALSANDWNPTGSSGGVTVTKTGDTVDVLAPSQYSKIKWDKYNVDKGEVVQYTFGGDGYNAVNFLDPGQSSSTIKGVITSAGSYKGNFFLINPNGMAFGEGALVQKFDTVVLSTNILDEIHSYDKMVRLLEPHKVNQSYRNNIIRLDDTSISYNKNIFLISQGVWLKTGYTGITRSDNKLGIYAVGDASVDTGILDKTGAPSIDHTYAMTVPTGMPSKEGVIILGRNVQGKSVDIVANNAYARGENSDISCREHAKITATGGDIYILNDATYGADASVYLGGISTPGKLIVNNSSSDSLQGATSGRILFDMEPHAVSAKEVYLRSNEIAFSEAGFKGMESLSLVADRFMGLDYFNTDTPLRHLGYNLKSLDKCSESSIIRESEISALITKFNPTDSLTLGTIDTLNTGMTRSEFKGTIGTGTLSNFRDLSLSLFSSGDINIYADTNGQSLKIDDLKCDGIGTIRAVGKLIVFEPKNDLLGKLSLISDTSDITIEGFKQISRSLLNLSAIAGNIEMKLGNADSDLFFGTINAKTGSIAGKKNITLTDDVTVTNTASPFRIGAKENIIFKNHPKFKVPILELITNGLDFSNYAKPSNNTIDDLRFSKESNALNITSTEIQQLLDFASSDIAHKYLSKLSLGKDTMTGNIGNLDTTVAFVSSNVDLKLKTQGNINLTAKGGKLNIMELDGKQATFEFKNDSNNSRLAVSGSNINATEYLTLKSDEVLIDGSLNTPKLTINADKFSVNGTQQTINDVTFSRYLRSDDIVTADIANLYNKFDMNYLGLGNLTFNGNIIDTSGITNYGKVQLSLATTKDANIKSSNNLTIGTVKVANAILEAAGTSVLTFNNSGSASNSLTMKANEVRINSSITTPIATPKINIFSNILTTAPGIPKIITDDLTFSRYSSSSDIVTGDVANLLKGFDAKTLTLGEATFNGNIIDEAGTNDYSKLKLSLMTQKDARIKAAGALKIGNVNVKNGTIEAFNSTLALENPIAASSSLILKANSIDLKSSLTTPKLVMFANTYDITGGTGKYTVDDVTYTRYSSPTDIVTNDIGKVLNSFNLKYLTLGDASFNNSIIDTTGTIDYTPFKLSLFTKKDAMIKSNANLNIKDVSASNADLEAKFNLTPKDINVYGRVATTGNLFLSGEALNLNAGSSIVTPSLLIAAQTINSNIPKTTVENLTYTKLYTAYGISSADIKNLLNNFTTTNLTLGSSLLEGDIIDEDFANNDYSSMKLSLQTQGDARIKTSKNLTIGKIKVKNATLEAQNTSSMAINDTAEASESLTLKSSNLSVNSGVITPKLTINSDGFTIGGGKQTVDDVTFSRYAKTDDIVSADVKNLFDKFNMKKLGLGSQTFAGNIKDTTGTNDYSGVQLSLATTKDANIKTNKNLNIDTVSSANADFEATGSSAITVNGVTKASTSLALKADTLNMNAAVQTQKIAINTDNYNVKSDIVKSTVNDVSFSRYSNRDKDIVAADTTNILKSYGSKTLKLGDDKFTGNIVDMAGTNNYNGTKLSLLTKKNASIKSAGNLDMGNINVSAGELEAAGTSTITLNDPTSASSSLTLKSNALSVNASITTPNLAMYTNTLNIAGGLGKTDVNDLTYTRYNGSNVDIVDSDIKQLFANFNIVNLTLGDSSLFANIGYGEGTIDFGNVNLTLNAQKNASITSAGNIKIKNADVGSLYLTTLNNSSIFLNGSVKASLKANLKSDKISFNSEITTPGLDISANTIDVKSGLGKYNINDVSYTRYLTNKDIQTVDVKNLFELFNMKTLRLGDMNFGGSIIDTSGTNDYSSVLLSLLSTKDVGIVSSGNLNMNAIRSKNASLEATGTSTITLGNTVFADDSLILKADTLDLKSTITTASLTINTDNFKTSGTKQTINNVAFSRYNKSNDIVSADVKNLFDKFSMKNLSLGNQTFAGSIIDTDGTNNYSSVQLSLATTKDIDIKSAGNLRVVALTAANGGLEATGSSSITLNNNATASQSLALKAETLYINSLMATPKLTINTDNFGISGAKQTIDDVTFSRYNRTDDIVSADAKNIFDKFNIKKLGLGSLTFAGNILDTEGTNDYSNVRLSLATTKNATIKTNKNLDVGKVNAATATLEATGISTISLNDAVDTKEVITLKSDTLNMNSTMVTPKLVINVDKFNVSGAKQTIDDVTFSRYNKTNDIVSADAKNIFDKFNMKYLGLGSATFAGNIVDTEGTNDYSSVELSLATTKDATIKSSKNLTIGKVNTLNTTLEAAGTSAITLNKEVAVGNSLELKSDTLNLNSSITGPKVKIYTNNCLAKDGITQNIVNDLTYTRYLTNKDIVTSDVQNLFKIFKSDSLTLGDASYSGKISDADGVNNYGNTKLSLLTQNTATIKSAGNLTMGKVNALNTTLEAAGSSTLTIGDAINSTEFLALASNALDIKGNIVTPILRMSTNELTIDSKLGKMNVADVSLTRYIGSTKDIVTADISKALNSFTATILTLGDISFNGNIVDEAGTNKYSGTKLSLVTQKDASIKSADSLNMGKVNAKNTTLEAAGVSSITLSEKVDSSASLAMKADTLNMNAEIATPKLTMHTNTYNVAGGLGKMSIDDVTYSRYKSVKDIVTADAQRLLNTFTTKNLTLGDSTFNGNIVDTEGTTDYSPTNLSLVTQKDANIRTSHNLNIKNVMTKTATLETTNNAILKLGDGKDIVESAATNSASKIQTSESLTLKSNSLLMNSEISTPKLVMNVDSYSIDPKLAKYSINDVTFSRYSTNNDIVASDIHTLLDHFTVQNLNLGSSGFTGMITDTTGYDYSKIKLGFYTTGDIELDSVADLNINDIFGGGMSAKFRAGATNNLSLFGSIYLDKNDGVLDLAAKTILAPGGGSAFDIEADSIKLTADALGINNAGYIDTNKVSYTKLTKNLNIETSEIAGITNRFKRTTMLTLGDSAYVGNIGTDDTALSLDFAILELITTGDLKLRAKNVLTLSSPECIFNSVDLQANQIVYGSRDYDLYSKGDIKLSAVNAIRFNGGIKSTDGSVNITLSDAGGIRIGDIKAKGGINVSASNEQKVATIALGKLESEGNINIAVKSELDGSDLSIGNASGNAITIDSNATGSSKMILGSLDANKDVTIVGNKIIADSTIKSKENIYIQANGLLSINDSITADKDVKIDTNAFSTTPTNKNISVTGKESTFLRSHTQNIEFKNNAVEGTDLAFNDKDAKFTVGKTTKMVLDAGENSDVVLNEDYTNKDLTVLGLSGRTIKMKNPNIKIAIAKATESNPIKTLINVLWKSNKGLRATDNKFLWSQDTTLIADNFDCDTLNLTTTNGNLHYKSVNKKQGSEITYMALPPYKVIDDDQPQPGPTPDPGGGGGSSSGAVVGGTVGGVAAAGVAAASVSQMGILPGLLLGLASPIQYDETMLDVVIDGKNAHPLLMRNINCVFQVDDPSKLDPDKIGSVKFIPDSCVANGSFELVKIKIPEKFANSKCGVVIKITEKSNPFCVTKQTPDLNFNVFNKVDDEQIRKLYESRKFMHKSVLSKHKMSEKCELVRGQDGLLQKTIVVSPQDLCKTLSIVVNYAKDGHIPRKGCKNQLKQNYSFVVQFCENK